jgi:hypothetical protein
MTEITKKLFDSGANNSEFLKDIWDADEDVKPGYFAGKTQKLIFASMYYGWLVNKYKKEWEQNL